MNWKDYEIEIYHQFQDMYPEAEITHNTTLLGRYSKIERQIDILIEDYVAGDRVRIMVDGKFFSEKIDIKEVECFIGMMQDVSADKGLLITQKGYSQAAIKRAHNDPSRIELDILNFDELKQFQSFIALPYSGKHGVVIPSPFGWVIDGTRRQGFLATIYQRGLSFEYATESKEWMYVNIFSKTEDINNLDTFRELQELSIKDKVPDAIFEYRKTVKRKDANTLLRTINIKTYPTPEHTGFVEFEKFIFFCVLFSPEELNEKNIKKLEYILSKALPINVDTESVLKSRFKTYQRQFDNTNDQIEKAEILISQAEVLKKLREYDECEQKYTESISLLKTGYGAIKGIIDLYLLTKKENDLNNMIDNFFNLEPTNPTICQDLIELFSNYKREDDLIIIFNQKIKDYEDNPEAQGNIHYHLGLVFIDKNKSELAKSNFLKAKMKFALVLPLNNYVFNLIDTNLKNN